MPTEDPRPAPSEEPPSTPEAAAAPRNGTGDGVLQRLRLMFGARQSLRASLEGALKGAEHEPDDALTAKERAMLRNVLGMRDLRVEDVMVPRADIDAIEIGSSIAELLNQFRDAGHSRLPVYRETLDDPAGMVHIKDLMSWMTSQATLAGEELARRRTPPACGLDLRKVALATPLQQAGLLRPVLYVPPSMPAGDLLVKMQATRIHLAVVVDEYGGTDGLASIEDLVEVIVGEIDDEHDERSAPMIVPTDDGGFVADARAPLSDLVSALGVDLEIGSLMEEIDTLGGLIFNRVGHIPVRGELVAFPGGFEFEILEADPRRIKRVRIHRRAPGASRAPRRERASGRSDAA